MSTTNHTPTPYEVAGHFIRTVRGATIAGVLDGQMVAETNHQDPQHAANAAFIVRACNSHDQLVTALRRIVESLAESDEEGLIEHSEIMIDARAALAAAGEQP